MNAFVFIFEKKRKLRGPEAVRKIHSNTNSRSRSRSRSSRSRSSSSRAREERERDGKREREREREGGRGTDGCVWPVSDGFLTGFWLVSDWFLTLQRDSCQLDLKAKAEIPRCTSGSGFAVAAGVVVLLRVVASLVMRVRIHAWTHSISNLGAK